MTIEDEATLEALRTENQRLRHAIREHRIIGETAESEVRRLNRERQHLLAAVKKLFEIKTRVRCTPCRHVLHEIETLLKADVELTS